VEEAKEAAAEGAAAAALTLSGKPTADGGLAGVSSEDAESAAAFAVSSVGAEEVVQAGAYTRPLLSSS